MSIRHMWRVANGLDNAGLNDLKIKTDTLMKNQIQKWPVINNSCHPWAKK